MLLRDSYSGGDSPFRGDKTIAIGGLPAGAQVRSATVTVRPAQAAAAAGFEELFVFPGEVAHHSPPPLMAADWGVTTTSQSTSVEVDLHARYELSSAVATPTSLTLAGASLQIDAGGLYVDISDKGTIKGPTDSEFSFQPDALPGLTTSRFKLTAPAGGAQAAKVISLSAVGVRSTPTNVSVRLGAQPPFFTVLGQLASSRASADFANALNAFLSTATADDGYYAISLVLHSDTIARLDLAVELSYVLVSSLLPTHLSQVTLPFDLSSRSGFAGSLPAARLPRDASLVEGQTAATIRGQFGPTRLVLGFSADGVSAIVSPQVALAQPFTLESDATAIGFDLRLQSRDPGTANLSLAVRPDEGGVPAQQIIGHPAPVSVGQPLPGQSGWVGVNLPTPIHLSGATRYWLVLQSLDADAEWSAAAPPPEGQLPLLSSQDGGLSWRPPVTEQTIRPVQAALHVRDQPDQFSIPVALQIGSGAQAVHRTLEEFAPLGRTEFAFDFAQKLQTYLGRVPPPCGSGELLVNGTFAQPTTDDATQRLFGKPAVSPRRVVGSVDLTGGVDLSVQHYLTLDDIKNQQTLTIDCAGANPSRTSLAEVVAAINRATRAVIASGTKFLELVQVQWRLRPYWTQDQPPASWTGNSQQIYRFGSTTDEGPVLAVLADPSAISALSLWPGGPGPAPSSSSTPSQPALLTQQVAAGSGCRYRLQASFGFRQPRGGAIMTPPPNPVLAPRWQIGWLDSTGTVLSTDSGPLPMAATAALRRVRSPLAADRLLDVSVTAPAHAAAAQVGFIHPLSSDYALFFERVSFTATAEQLTNAEFSQWDATSAAPAPDGWTVESGIVTPIVDPVTGTPAGVTLGGGGPTDTVLTQRVPVDAGTAYAFAVRAQPVVPANAPATPAARVEIEWRAAGRSLSTTKVIIGPDAFTERAWSGEAPAGATSAHLRLVQPGNGGTLAMTLAHFTKPEIVEVPLAFTSESPGQLTVSSFQLAYDRPEPPDSLTLNGEQPAASGAAGAELLADDPAALQTIPGIGTVRARRLGDAGIGSLALLADATPEEVTQALPGIRPEVAAEFVSAARARLASRAAPGSGDGGADGWETSASTGA